MCWKTIDSAPQDGTPILGWCRHDADLYYDDNDDSLTPYGCHCEGLNHVSDGPHVVLWVDDYQDGDWENGYITIPGWWFRDDSDFEVVANPTHWMSIPEEPKPE